VGGGNVLLDGECAEGTCSVFFLSEETLERAWQERSADLERLTKCILFLSLIFACAKQDDKKGWNYMKELHRFVEDGMQGTNFIDAVSGEWSIGLQKTCLS